MPPGLDYEWAGSREAFARWLNRFYDLVELEASDIAALFGGKVSEQHRSHVIDWWVEVMGGPAVYTEQRGGYEHMLARHHNLAITPEQRLAFVTLLSRAADDVGLPSDPEFRAAIMGYAEWGTRLAMHNSQPGTPTVAHAPVPRWGWGVAPPYQPDADPSTPMRTTGHPSRARATGPRPSPESRFITEPVSRSWAGGSATRGNSNIVRAEVDGERSPTAGQ